MFLSITNTHIHTHIHYTCVRKHRKIITMEMSINLARPRVGWWLECIFGYRVARFAFASFSLSFNLVCQNLSHSENSEKFIKWENNWSCYQKNSHDNLEVLLSITVWQLLNWGSEKFTFCSFQNFGFVETDEKLDFDRLWSRD